MKKSKQLTIAITCLMISISSIAAPKETPQRFLLVSFSMPMTSLAAYCQAATSYHVTLVLRGLVNNQLSATALTMRDNTLHACDWQVEPRLFSTFNVRVVPTLLVFDAPLQPGWSDSPKLPVVNAVSGHVNLPALIAHLEKGSPS